MFCFDIEFAYPGPLWPTHRVPCPGPAALVGPLDPYAMSGLCVELVALCELLLRAAGRATSATGSSMGSAGLGRMSSELDDARPSSMGSGLSSMGSGGSTSPCGG